MPGLKPHLALHSALAALSFAIVASTAVAQPANRPVAFASAISAASGQAPGWIFYEADLENESGQWVFEVHVVSPAGNSMLEYEVDPSTIAILRSRPKSLSSGKTSEIQSAIAFLSGATITAAQAITIAAGRTPDGTQMQHIERGVESSHAAYKFDFAGTLGTQRIVVDAVSGNPSGGGTGGGTTPPGSGDITLDQAIQAALILYPGARILETEFEADDARWEIRLVTAQGVVRKVRISVAGALLTDDEHRRGREDAADDRLKINSMQSAVFTLAQAKAIAMAGASGATAIRAEWEFEHGVLLAKVALQDSAGIRTVLVNATSGAIVTPVPDPAPAPQPAPIVGIADAAAAGAAANPGSAAIEVEMELNGGRQFYKVKTLSRTTPLWLREVVIDGKTGIARSNTLLPMASVYLPTARQIAALLPTATVSLAGAQQIAVATLADGQVQGIELEPEEGTFLTYNVDVLVGAKVFQLVIDSRTGSVRPK